MKVSKLVGEPAPIAPRRMAGNAWIDEDANLRSGASGESGVMFQTTRQARITVQSWSKDGQWAWVTINWGGEDIGAWTHKVNVTLD